MLRQGLAILIVLFSPATLGAPPTPDRPSVSLTGSLAQPGTMEMEVGALWAGKDFHAPAYVKYSYRGLLEPRIGMDLATMSASNAHCWLGLKGRLLKTKKIALAVYVETTLPVADKSPATETIRLLLDVVLNSRFWLQVNAGVNIDGDTVDGFDSVPVTLLVGSIVRKNLGVFLEGAATITEDGDVSGIVGAGLGWKFSDRAIFDVGLGYNITDSTPMIQMGLSLNFSR
jgi:hypothetical protein